MLGAWGKTDCLDGCPQVGLLLVLVLSLLISLLVHLWLSSKDPYLTKYYKPAFKKKNLIQLSSETLTLSISTRIQCQVYRENLLPRLMIYVRFRFENSVLLRQELLGKSQCWVHLALTCKLSKFLHYSFPTKQLIFRSISLYSCTTRKTIYTSRMITPSLRQNRISHFRHATWQITAQQTQ
jgi:hypothetical protein